MKSQDKADHRDRKQTNDCSGLGVYVECGGVGNNSVEKTKQTSKFVQPIKRHGVKGGKKQKTRELKCLERWWY